MAVPLYDDFKRHWTSRHPDTNPVWIHMGSAVMAGGISDVICNPMFVVRTRLQTEALHHIVEGGASPGRPTGMIQTAKSLYSEGGPLVFWRGMTANLMGLSHAAIQFPVYEQLKKTFRHDKEQESALDLLLASGLSKMTASMISYPHEVIRSRMMDARAGSIGFVQTCTNIYSQEGMVGFYAGLPVSLIRVIPNTCITFLTYELILRYARTKIKEHRNNGN
jgi:solute carrier family 25 folate transporter 32